MKLSPPTVFRPCRCSWEWAGGGQLGCPLSPWEDRGLVGLSFLGHTQLTAPYYDCSAVLNNAHRKLPHRRGLVKPRLGWCLRPRLMLVLPRGTCAPVLLPILHSAYAASSLDPGLSAHFPSPPPPGLPSSWKRQEGPLLPPQLPGGRT